MPQIILKPFFWKCKYFIIPSIQGIGIHHAGMSLNDRTIVEKLFLEQKIKILIATSTLAWGINLPAYMVILKGTEYYDANTKTYGDYPTTGNCTFTDKTFKIEINWKIVQIWIINAPESLVIHLKHIKFHFNDVFAMQWSN